MKINFKQLTTPNTEIAQVFNKWENDSNLRPLMRPNRNQADIDLQISLTVDSLKERLQHCITYLIYAEEQLIGQMNFQIDFQHLFGSETNASRTAWIGMGIGEVTYHKQGIGTRALAFLEKQVKQKGLKRIELGVFEFNKPALELYRNSGYQEIGRVKKFTYWQGKMWPSIHMEKHL